jgi:hypothetical protein
MRHISDIDNSAPKPPRWTYETLEKELYHKGTGALMMRRKWASNTWVHRRPHDLIAVELHTTDILTFFPDDRVVLTHGGWQTQTTKNRMNDFLGNYVHVFSNHGNWHITCRFRIGDTEYGEPKWVKGTVPFENGMAINVWTGEIVAHPHEKPIPLDESFILNEVKRLTRDLRNQTWRLQRRAWDHNPKPFTKEEVLTAMQYAAAFEKRAETLLGAADTLVVGVRKSLDDLHEEVERALQYHKDYQINQQEVRRQIPGQLQVREFVNQQSRYPYYPDSA